MTNKIFCLILAMVVLVAVGCTSSSDDQSSSTGTLVLKITDAPVDSDEISGVYIAITKIEVNKSTSNDANWEAVKDFDSPKEVNLRELTNGVTELLGDFEMTSGQYNQIRFILEIQEEGQELEGDSPESVGCYVEFNDNPDDIEPLFVPSGEKSGYKAVGAFEVPVNGEVNITVDFDLRKALHITGSGNEDGGNIENNEHYILRPTLRLVVDSNAGNISGDITLETSYTDIIVFAYEAGEWAASEAADPAEGESRFPNAVTSTKMDDDDNGYKLAYLAYGTYDLVVVGYNGETFGDVLGTVSDVEIDSNNTPTPIDSTNLEPLETA